MNGVHQPKRFLPLSPPKSSVQPAVPLFNISVEKDDGHANIPHYYPAGIGITTNGPLHTHYTHYQQQQHHHEHYRDDDTTWGWYWNWNWNWNWNRLLSQSVSYVLTVLLSLLLVGGLLLFILHYNGDTIAIQLHQQQQRQQQQQQQQHQEQQQETIPHRSAPLLPPLPPPLPPPPPAPPSVLSSLALPVALVQYERHRSRRLTLPFCEGVIISTSGGSSGSSSRSSGKGHTGMANMHDLRVFNITAAMGTLEMADLVAYECCCYDEGLFLCQGTHGAAALAKYTVYCAMTRRPSQPHPQTHTQPSPSLHAEWKLMIGLGEAFGEDNAVCSLQITTVQEQEQEQEKAEAEEKLLSSGDIHSVADNAVLSPDSSHTTTTTHDDNHDSQASSPDIMDKVWT